MTEEPIYGLGALPNPPDARDYPVSALYAAEGLNPTPVAALPVSYLAPGMPPVLDQGATPQCTAFSTSAMKAWMDRRDQGRYFDFDEGLFFRQIGGTADGAFTRDAFAQMRSAGYPVVSSGDASAHRIAAYYSVPATYAELKAAIYDLGPIVISTAWYRSWFTPGPDGVLPAPNVIVGGHAIVAYGWSAKGLRLRNSWGRYWGSLDGDCIMAPYQIAALWDAWKAVDQIVHPIPYVHTVDVLARPSLNARSSPSTAAAKIASLAYGRDLATTRLEKYGGKYVANGVARTDWLEVKISATRKGWVARGYTRLIG